MPPALVVTAAVVPDVGPDVTAVAAGPEVVADVGCVDAKEEAKKILPVAGSK